MENQKWLVIAIIQNMHMMLTAFAISSLVKQLD